MTVDRLQSLSAIERHIRQMERCFVHAPLDLRALKAACRNFLQVAPEDGLGDLQKVIDAVRRTASTMTSLQACPSPRNVEYAASLFGWVRAAIVSRITCR